MQSSNGMEIFGPGEPVAALYRSCPSRLADSELNLFVQGRHRHAHRLLGARVHAVDGTAGVLFSVWAPNAVRVSVVGDFNRRDGRSHPMQVHGDGFWELFIPGLPASTAYQYQIQARNGEVLLKSDPFGRRFEVRPDTASIVEAASTFKWSDAQWLEERADCDWQHAPVSIYEVHLGSWQRDEQGEMPGYREIAPRLVAHAQALGFTHIELMPVTEHPHDESWGYQTTGYYAPTSRFGSPDDFRWFVDFCHRNGMGVILDWVPAHFPRDSHGLACFDGTALYEHDDPEEAENRDWGTLNFNFGCGSVRSFLISSALFWLEEFHVDGLRMDAVSSMLKQDYVPGAEAASRPRRDPDNLDAVGFMRELNAAVHQQVPGALVMAEDSSSWPKVTRPAGVGGLGFDLKWNMGWMNDTLRYLRREPVHRSHHQDELAFSIHYAFRENFLLPLSHDEVVHGKQSLLCKMPGDDWLRFDNLRLLYVYMFTHPGKKLLFMGSEFGQVREWDCNAALDWPLRNDRFHQGVERLVGDLNRLYRCEPALHGLDFDSRGFAWLDQSDSESSVLVYQRRMGEEFVVTALNFTPVPRRGYRIGVPAAGPYREILNSDAADYGGCNMGNGRQPLCSQATPWKDQPHSLLVTLPPMAGIVLKLVPDL